MSRLLATLPGAAVLGHLLGLLGWIDALFFPMLLAFPLVVGAVAASRGLRAAWPAVLNLSAGLCLLWTDWVVNREDVAFHAVAAVFTALLSLAGWGAVTLATRSRRREAVGVSRPA